VALISFSLAPVYTARPCGRKLTCELLLILTAPTHGGMAWLS